ncbi:hypothetical protein BMS3Bbin07_00046 [bacterium BMS3Bbin07]|nr:hypothetical protein BMS3Bbin07_00046 [bacterium BMS3Bbin07]
MEIKELHKNSHRTYGSPRITDELQAKGIRCGKNRVARIMKVHGIVAKATKKFKATTNSKHNLTVAENLLNQNLVSRKSGEDHFKPVSAFSQLSVRYFTLFLL